MACCELYAIATPEWPGYRWRWRTIGGEAQSRDSFVFFYECMADAIANGHTVDLEATVVTAKQYGKAPAK